MSASTRKRPPPAAHPSPAAHPPKHQATTPPSQQPAPRPPLEEEFLDEDVYLDETLIPGDDDHDEEYLILRDIEERQGLASRLSKWARPPLSDGYLSQSKNVVYQQLEIDYVIAESHRELLPDRSGPAAIIRIFGVTREVFAAMFMGSSRTSTLVVLREWAQMIFPVFIKFSREG